MDITVKTFTINIQGKSFSNWSIRGGDIQSFSAKKLLPFVDGGVFRDNFKQSGHSGIIAMNGYILGECDWSPHTINIESEKEQIRDEFLKAFSLAKSKFRACFNWDHYRE